jgi:xanthine/CO dehydrogenase XdhC/CoxF family maturation factor
MRELLADVDRWQSQGKPVAVATVVSVAGSAPRGVGAKLAVSGDGDMAGSVSGGCVENAVVETALEVLESGRPQLVKFGVSDEDAWEVGLACGGTIEVFVEPLLPAPHHPDAEMGRRGDAGTNLSASPRPRVPASGEEGGRGGV